MYYDTTTERWHDSRATLPIARSQATPPHGRDHIPKPIKGKAELAQLKALKEKVK